MKESLIAVLWRLLRHENYKIWGHPGQHHETLCQKWKIRGYLFFVSAQMVSSSLLVTRRQGSPLRYVGSTEQGASYCAWGCTQGQVKRLAFGWLSSFWYTCPGCRCSARVFCLVDSGQGIPDTVSRQHQSGKGWMHLFHIFWILGWLPLLGQGD